MYVYAFICTARSCGQVGILQRHTKQIRKLFRLARAFGMTFKSNKYFPTITFMQQQNRIIFDHIVVICLLEAPECNICTLYRRQLYPKRFGDDFSMTFEAIARKSINKCFENIFNAFVNCMCMFYYVHAGYIIYVYYHISIEE